MTLNSLYDLAEKEHVQIYDWYIENANGAFINIDKLNIIALNYDELGTYIDEKETLAEELGHYYRNCTYPLYCTDNQFISRQEYKAKKWKSTTLVTKNALFKALKKGCNTFYEIAEELCVKEDTVEFAYNYYKENGLILTNEEVLQSSINF